MIFPKRFVNFFLRGALVLMLVCMFALNGSATNCNCSLDAAEPPFLSQGADPNVLLMIDNSASMYDVAYNDPAKKTWECFDESFNPGNVYAGYFENDLWYAYDTSAAKFVPFTEALPASAKAGGLFYMGTTQAGNDVRIEVYTENQITKARMHAKGNLLNWATASKFDIQKAVLTGGKYEDNLWTSEGRGCSGHRYAKQTSVFLGNTAHKLTMAVHAFGKEEGDIESENTLLEIFEVTKDGYNYEACQAVIDNILNDKLAVGDTLKCFETSKQDEPRIAHEKQVLIHTTIDCWSLNKHGDRANWPMHDTNLIKDCKELYQLGVNPEQITPSDIHYACYGGIKDEKPYGFIGQCWDPSKADWLYTDKKLLESCIKIAMKDYCGYFQTPEVIDPSDLQMVMDDYDTAVYNFPAIITDGGLLSQLRKPILDWPVRVQKAEGAPEPGGVVQEFASSVRIGAMAFNRRGSGTECVDGLRTDVLYKCDGENRDGAHVIWPIGSETEMVGHVDGLVAKINDTKADTWTPLAEMMFTAIGYYTRRSEFELNIGHDWSHLPWPITEYCQSNNVLIITDGASTADQRAEVLKNMDGDVNDRLCGDLFGSTYFDDWTFYARQGKDLYAASPYNFLQQPEPINTFVVYTDSDRSRPDDQCSPYGLLKAAVEKGGPNATSPGPTDVVFEGDDPAKLKKALRDAFKTILKRASAGSAASVISATRSGEGAVYQAIFWPGIDGANGMPDATWAGEVHALLVDDMGWLYEDTDGDKGLSAADQRVIFFFDELGTPAETKACYGEIENGTCKGELKSLHDVQYLWSAAKWLADIDDTDIVQNRTDYISDQRRRFIFTWNDLDNDGRVDPDEILPFEAAANIGALQVTNRRDLSHDFGVAGPDKLNEIINWVRGKDSPGPRSRAVHKPVNFNLTDASQSTITWRLGDIIHSTPTVVGRPSESYHLLYQDESYAKFAAHYKNRRQVVYFGANDGMLHAVNGGFYDQMSRKYCLTPDCAENATGPALGAELWAYVPYNLQPQLKCLLEPDYLHRYYVDQKPRIFDVQIFDHTKKDYPNGWGTILVAGMRLGGNTVSAQGTDEIPDNRKFSSSYIILDVTNPEVPPSLLGELTYDPDTSAHMGYTTAIPTVVPMKSENETKWYLVLGSGPLWLDDDDEWESNKAIEGRSNRPAKIAAFPLDALTRSGPAPFRIADPAKPDAPVSGYAGERLWVLSDANSFISDLITVDFDIDREYRGDAVYFGTVEGNWDGWGGKMYRIATNADDSMTEPIDWSVPKLLLNPNRPITAAPSVGWDGYNYWIYFGTGRFFDKQDKKDDSSNAQDYYFGIKEPLDCSNDPPRFTWDTIKWDPVTTPANLLRTDQIQVFKSDDPGSANLGCHGGGSGCLPTGGTITSLGQLIDHIAGHGCDDKASTGLAGWYRHFPETERNLGQATLLGGLLTYTTYQPFDDVCLPDGLSFLEAVYYQTGTAWHHAVFKSPYGLSQDTPQEVLPRLGLGHGLALTPNLHVGRQDGARAFIQTSTGAIVEIDQALPIDNVKSGRINWRDD
jgi:type IV pilus assembly protein PilY1